MLWQQLIVAMIVAGAAAYVMWRAWRTWFGSKSGCGGGCGCATKDKQPGNDEVLISVGQVRIRRK
jgi:hypothetical protein